MEIGTRRAEPVLDGLDLGVTGDERPQVPRGDGRVFMRLALIRSSFLVWAGLEDHLDETQATVEQLDELRVSSNDGLSIDGRTGL